MRSFAFSALFAGYVAAQATHTVIVGGVKPPADPTSSPTPMFVFTPETITANVGDMVLFEFMQANHSITQSTFAEPCKKKADGIDSEFKPNAQGNPGVTFMMPVSTTDPLWFYCKQKTGSHCGKGMVFSVNAKAGVAEQSHAMFKQLAVQQNGTALQQAGIQAAQAAPPAPSTVTIAAQSAAATGTQAAPAGAAAASVAPGQGVNGQGQACSCSCLCGMNSFPSNVGQGNFGGFPGMMMA